MRQLSAIVLVSALLGACGGSSSQFTSGEPVPISALPGELAKALCNATQACNPFFSSVLFSNVECVTLVSGQLQEGAFTQIEAAVTAGTVKYDAKKAASCVAEVNTGSCSVLDNNLPAVCRQALSGTVSTGGACEIDSQCAGLARCDISGGTCPGKCAALASAGVACVKDGDCALGLTCSEVTQHCAAPPGEGDACEGGMFADCSAGFICIGSDDEEMRSGVCKAPDSATKQVGEACDVQQGPWCVAGAACIVEGVADKMPVATCHATAAPGGTCGLGIPSECPKGQYCPLTFVELATGTLTSKCVALPTEGQECASGLSFSRCAGDLRCDATTKPLEPAVCITARHLGESCSSDELCISDHCVEQVCVPESQCAK